MKLKTLALSLLAAGVLAGCSAHSSVDTMKSDKIIIDLLITSWFHVVKIDFTNFTVISWIKSFWHP